MPWTSRSIRARTRSRGSVDIEIRIKEKTSLLWLNASDLTIAKASANAGARVVGVRTVPGGENFAGFAFDKPLAPGGPKLPRRVRRQAG